MKRRGTAKTAMSKITIADSTVEIGTIGRASLVMALLPLVCRCGHCAEPIAQVRPLSCLSDRVTTDACAVPAVDKQRAALRARQNG